MYIGIATDLGYRFSGEVGSNAVVVWLVLMGSTAVVGLVILQWLGGQYCSSLVGGIAMVGWAVL